MPSRYWPSDAYDEGETLAFKADTMPVRNSLLDFGKDVGQGFARLGQTTQKVGEATTQLVQQAGQIAREATQAQFPDLPDIRAFTRHWDEPNEQSSGPAGQQASRPAPVSGGVGDVGDTSGPAPPRPSTTSTPSKAKSSLSFDLPDIRSFTRLWDSPGDKEAPSSAAKAPFSVDLAPTGNYAQGPATVSSRTGEAPAPSGVRPATAPPRAAAGGPPPPSAGPSQAPAPPAPSGPPPAAGDWEGKARAAAVAAGHPDPDEFVEQIRQESQFDPDVISGKRASPAGAQGIAQIMPEVARGAGVNPLDPDAALAYAARRMAGNYKTYGNSDDALAEYNMGAGNLKKYGARGLGETKKYLEIIQGAAQAAKAARASAPQVPAEAPVAALSQRTSPVPQAPAVPPPGTYTPEKLVPNQLSEGREQGLSTQEALAVCGPAAAVAFARANGRNPTIREAKELAEKSGVWDVGAGMHGPASEVQLLDKMGVPARLAEGADWNQIAREVQAGRPVILDSPQHYFVASGYDPQTGEFEFGESANVLAKSGGKTKWRPQDISKLGMGDVRATIYMGRGQ